MSLARAALVLGMILAVAGCGSPSYLDTARSSVSSMRDAISAYNGSRPRNVAQTGTACADALAKLKDAGALNTGKPPARYAGEVAALRQAYGSALAGFTDCRRAAATNSYPLMFRADRELAAANGWLARAAKLEHH